MGIPTERIEVTVLARRLLEAGGGQPWLRRVDEPPSHEENNDVRTGVQPREGVDRMHRNFEPRDRVDQAEVVRVFGKHRRKIPVKRHVVAKC